MKVSRCSQCFFGLILTVCLSGCASLGLYDVTDCGDPREAKIFSVVLGPSSGEQVVRFEPPDSGDVCVTVTRLGSFDGAAMPDQPIRFRMGPDPAVRALVGGAEVELDYNDGDWRQDRLSFSVQVAPDVEQTLRVTTQDVAVLIEGIRRSFPPEPEYEVPDIPPFNGPDYGGGVATQTIRLPEVICNGRLLGFEHPLRFGSPELAAQERPEIHRQVRVACDAVWRIEYPNRRSVRRLQSGTGTFTDAAGVFSASISPDTVTVQRGFNLNVILERLEPRCVPVTLCGYEHRNGPAAPQLELFVEAVAAGNNQFDVNIVDVLDIVSQGPEAAGFHTMLGARLISNAATHPARNDRPFIIHEQIDVHNEEHTRFFVWGLSGQPVRLRWTDWRDDFSEKYVDPRIEPCRFADEQVCLPFRENCNPSICDSEDMACLEYPMLEALLQADYDVWIIDNLRGEADLTHAAAAAPLLYQKILNFGGPLSGDGIEPMAVTGAATAAAHAQDVAAYNLQVEQFLLRLEEEERILNPDLANEFFNENALPQGPVATAPQSGDRRAVVAGYSMGGVLARIGLRMWETRDSFPHTVIRDQLDRPLEVATQPGVFMEEPGDKIALYVSLDVPHLGARVPLAVQAHLHRLNYTLEQIGGFASGVTEQIDKAITELTATPARQVMQQEVNPLYKNNSLGCFQPADESMSTCTVTSIEPDIQSRLFEVESTLFRARWIDVISGLEPETRHGLPATVPSIGISNGGIAETRSVASREVANVRWHLTRGAPDKRHRLCDELSGELYGLDCTGGETDHGDGSSTVHPALPGLQPEGAQWNNICRRITDQRIDKAVGRCEDGVGSCYADIFGVELQKVSIDYRMRQMYQGRQPVPGTGFPTLVPTRSALFQDENGNVSSAWRDAQWQPASQYHTNFDNEMCRVILFHADGAFDGDGDGWPACGDALNISDCRLGGRRPGMLLDPEGVLTDDAWCDSEPENAEVFPGAALD